MKYRLLRYRLSILAILMLMALSGCYYPYAHHAYSPAYGGYAHGHGYPYRYGYGHGYRHSYYRGYGHHYGGYRGHGHGGHSGHGHHHGY